MMKMRIVLLLIILGMATGLRAQMMPFWGQEKNYPVAHPEEIDVKTLDSNLPLVVIDADTTIVAKEKVGAKISVIDNGKHNRIGRGTASFEGRIRIKLRGNSSLMLNQKKYTFETCDADGRSVDVSLLGMPAESDWVLLAPYNDVSLLRDVFAFTLWREMGHWAPRTRMVELVLNGRYAGVYALSESIKRGPERVDVEKLKANDLTGRDVTGGYILRIDVEDEKDASFPSKVKGVGGGFMGGSVIWSCMYPKKKNLQAEQFNYIRSFIDDMEATIQSPHFEDPDSGYARYMDVESFVDYFIHTEFSLNADGLRRSTYFYKEKLHSDGSGDRLHAGPVWDYNLAFGIGSFNGADNIESWVYKGGDTQPISAFWGRLLEDPAYRRKVKERYQELRGSVLSEQHINAFFDDYAKLLKKAQKRQFAVYPELLASKEEMEDIAKAKKEGRSMSPFGGFPQMPDSLQGNPFGGGFPPFGGFPQMPDSLQGNPFGGGFPPFGGFPQMPDSLQGNPFGGGFPPFGGFPQMPDSLQGNPFGGGFPPFPEGFQFPGGMQMPEGFQFPSFGGGATFMLRMFQGYRVTSYEEEIRTIKQWCSDRLKVMDRVISTYDTEHPEI